MKHGFTLPGRGPLAAPEKLGIIARKGEELGFDALLAGDHILVPRNISSPYPYTEGGEFPGSPSGESMEQITLLSYIARRQLRRDRGLRGTRGAARGRLGGTDLPQAPGDIFAEGVQHPLLLRRVVLEPPVGEVLVLEGLKGLPHLAVHTARQ